MVGTYPDVTVTLVFLTDGEAPVRVTIRAMSGPALVR